MTDPLLRPHSPPTTAATVSAAFLTWHHQSCTSFHTPTGWSETESRREERGSLQGSERRRKTRGLTDRKHLKEIKGENAAELVCRWGGGGIVSEGGFKLQECPVRSSGKTQSPVLSSASSSSLSVFGEHKLNTQAGGRFWTLLHCVDQSGKCVISLICS